MNRSIDNDCERQLNNSFTLLSNSFTLLSNSLITDNNIYYYLALLFTRGKICLVTLTFDNFIYRLINLPYHGIELLIPLIPFEC